MLLFVLNADPTSHIGKVDKTSLSQQTLMEILIEKIENRELICSPNRTLMESLVNGFRYIGLAASQHNETKDISEWKGMKINKNEEVTFIDWRDMALSGTIRFEWLPFSVKSMNCSNNRDLKGEIETSHLPAAMTYLDLYECSISGTFDLQNLPPEIEIIDGSTNRFTGSVDLEHLPETLIRLYLSHNTFSGTVSLIHFPHSMIDLVLDDNKLSGTIDLTRLPSGMRYVLLNRNAFSGTVDLTELSDELESLGIGSNSFYGTIDVTKLPRHMKILYLSGNAFSGMTDFSNLPNSLTRLYIGDTQLEGNLPCPRGCDCDASNTKVNVVQH